VNLGMKVWKGSNIWFSTTKGRKFLVTNRISEQEVQTLAFAHENKIGLPQLKACNDAQERTTLVKPLECIGNKAPAFALGLYFGIGLG